MLIINLSDHYEYLRHNVGKRTFGYVRLTKSQNRLFSLIRIFTRRSLNSQACAVPSCGLRYKISDLIVRMRTLIWVFIGRTSEGRFSHIVSYLMCNAEKSALLPWANSKFHVQPEHSRKPDRVFSVPCYRSCPVKYVIRANPTAKAKVSLRVSRMRTFSVSLKNH